MELTYRDKSLQRLDAWLKDIEENVAAMDALAESLKRTGMDPYEHVEACKTMWNGAMELHDKVFGFTEEERTHFRARYDEILRKQGKL